MKIIDLLVKKPFTLQELIAAYQMDFPENDSTKLFTPDAIAIWVGTAKLILNKLNELPDEEKDGCIAANTANALIAGMVVLNNRLFGDNIPIKEKQVAPLSDGTADPVGADED